MLGLVNPLQNACMDPPDGTHPYKCYRSSEDVLFETSAWFVRWLLIRYVLWRVWPAGARLVPATVFGMVVILSSTLSDHDRNVDWTHVCAEATPRVWKDSVVPHIDTWAVGYGSATAAFELGRGFLEEGTSHLLFAIAALLSASSVYTKVRPLAEVFEVPYYAWECAAYLEHPSEDWWKFWTVWAMIISRGMVIIPTGLIVICTEVGAPVWYIVAEMILSCIKVRRFVRETHPSLVVV
jgi:hypothetical protein